MTAQSTHRKRMEKVLMMMRKSVAYSVGTVLYACGMQDDEPRKSDM